jgi:predicted hydrocarbon binding protein
MIIGMGRNFVEISKKTPMGAELRAARNVRELYEIFQECNIVERYMERNCQWRVAFVGAHRCIVEGTPEREFISMLGKEYMTSEAACLVRQGFIASIPGYLGYPPANIRKLSCVARGDSSCRYDLDFLPILKSNDRRFQTVQQQA